MTASAFEHKTGEKLDTPDGLQVTQINADNGEPALTFYTGRWTVEFARYEVEELRDALTRWLEAT